MAILPFAQSFIGSPSLFSGGTLAQVAKYALILAPASLALYVILYELDRLRSRVRNLPGPLGYPIVGSLPSLRGKVPAQEYWDWARQKYGDVFQVQLGSTTVVVVNTAAAARTLFITQREATNGRPFFYVLHKKVQQGGPVTSIGTSPWDDSCKRRRKVAATALNKTSSESYYPILDMEARAFLQDMLEACQGGTAVVDILDPVRKFALNLSLTLSYGTRVEDVKDLRDNLLLSEIIYIEEQISKFRDVSTNFTNYIPLLRPFDTLAGWLGLKDGKHLADVGKRRYAYHAALQQNLRAEIAKGVDRPCIQGNVLKDPESKGLTENELLSVSLSMMAGSDTTKRSLMWAILLLAHRQDIQQKAYQAIVDAGGARQVLEMRDGGAAHTRIEYVEAFAKEVGRYFVVLRLALPKATHLAADWNGAKIPPHTMMFLNSWACARDPAVFQDAEVFAPERWLGGEQTANRHQFAFGMGGRMCVASHIASKALYTVFLHLIARFKILPVEGADPSEVDPLVGLLSQGNHQAAPKARFVRVIPREAEK